MRAVRYQKFHSFRFLLLIAGLHLAAAGAASAQNPPNSPPYFTPDPPVFNIPINEFYGTVGYLSAYDPEGDWLFFDGYDPAGKFQVDSMGRIDSPHMFTAGESYSFPVWVEDAYSLVETTATVNFTASTNSPPVFDEDPYVFDVPINQQHNLIGPVHATDYEWDSVWYSIVSDPSGEFTMDAGTGDITFNGLADVGDSFTFTIQAADNFGSDTTTVTVNIVPAEDQPPEILQMWLVYHGYNVYTVWGQVGDEFPGTCYVTFGGMFAGTGDCDSQGVFEEPAYWWPEQEGWITAVATDEGGQVSAEYAIYKMY